MKYQSSTEGHSVPRTVPTGGTKARRKVEDHIQAAVAMVLDELGLLWFHVPNELGGMVTVGHLGQLIAMGLKKGVSDCVILDRAPAMPEARFIALELKAPGGRPTPDQVAFIARARELGGVGKVARGLAAAIEVITGLGWPVEDALRRLRERGHIIEGERMVRLPRSAPRGKKRPSGAKADS